MQVHLSNEYQFTRMANRLGHQGKIFFSCECLTFFKDRCIIGRFTLSERDDKKLLDVLSVPVDESLRGLQQFHILRSQRRQYIFARIGKMIEMKQLPEVNLSLAHTYVKLILQRAHKVVSETSVTKPFNDFCCWCSVWIGQISIPTHV